MNPLFCRQDSEERGRHLVASRRITENQLIFCERPLVALQSLQNVQTTLVCQYCRSFCGSLETQLGLASGRLTRQDVLNQGDAALVSCRDECGQVYCCKECENDAWTSSHSLLCTGHIASEDIDHVLLQFKIHAVQHNEIFLAVADAIASMILHPPLQEYWTDFLRTPWWDVLTEPLMTSATGLVEAAELESTTKRFCQESSALLKQALLLEKNIDSSLVEKYCTAENFGALIGSFGQNAIGIRLQNPLCRAVLEDASLRESPDFIASLQLAGMIGTDDETESQDNNNNQNNREGQEPTKDQHENESQDDKDEKEYSIEELTELVAGLDDLDELFVPLDGTAMYATACKMNHSCDPNVVVLYPEGGNMPLVAYCRALRDIEPGEELCISYIDSDEPLEVRQEALANYGFCCSCPKCLDEENTKGGLRESELDQDDLFGPDSDDDESDDGSDNSTNHEEQDGDTKLQERLVKLDTERNKDAVNTIPINALALACNYVIQTGSLALQGLPTAIGLQECLEAVRARNFVECVKAGSFVESGLLEMLQRDGSWPNTAYREAYGCGALTCSIGHLHVGSMLMAQSMLDKTFILGLRRSQIEEYADCVEYFCNQVARGPCPPAISCMLQNTLESCTRPLEFAIPEADPDISLEDFESTYVTPREPVVLRNFAKDWAATAKWRDLKTLVWNHFHRLIPVELGSMMKSGGMKEQIMTIRSFVELYLVPSNDRSLWTLEDAIGSESSVAYLAQHPLLDQIPALYRDVEMSPHLCRNPPTNRNVWIGTGGTRTPLHFDSYDNLLVQIVGYKYVRVYATSQTDKLYVVRADKMDDTAAQGNMSAVNCELEDYDQHPLAKDAMYQEAYLGPGDCLFIPARMWHYVRSLSTSISVNYWW